jgi:hypothetical protein
MKSVLQLEKVLREELDLYGEVCALEEKKGGAIIAKDGKLLESLSLEQEGLLGGISALEERRRGAIDTYRKENLPSVIDAEVSLRDILRTLDGDTGVRLTRLGTELKHLLLKMQALAETNEKLARDNIEFYNILLAELKSRVSLKTGYTRKAVENSTIENPLIFNRMV